eukprot:354894-Chlamydomonas_euryale.AAC.7
MLDPIVWDSARLGQAEGIELVRLLSFSLMPWARMSSMHACHVMQPMHTCCTPCPLPHTHPPHRHRDERVPPACSYMCAHALDLCHVWIDLGLHFHRGVHPLIKCMLTASASTFTSRQDCLRERKFAHHAW